MHKKNNKKKRADLTDKQPPVAISTTACHLVNGEHDINIPHHPAPTPKLAQIQL